MIHDFHRRWLNLEATCARLARAGHETNTLPTAYSSEPAMACSNAAERRLTA